jgi:Family of unknown function (DUF6585)
MTPNDNADSTRAGASSGGPEEIPSEHAVHRDGIISKYQMPIFCFVAFLLLGGVFLYFGFAREETWLYVIGGLVMAVGAACLVYVLVNMNRGVRRVLLTEAGIRWEDDQAAHEEKWEDVREVYTKEIITRGDRITDVRVVFADGSEMKADNRLRKYDSLRRSLLSLSRRALLARKRRELADGQAEFGPVVLHPDGVQVKEDRKRWDELEQWTIRNGFLYIISTDPKDRYGWETPLFNVPNYPVLLQLLEELWQAQTPPAMSIPFGGGRRRAGP